jgi:tetratricopeptide (TPR) repeat protein
MVTKKGGKGKSGKSKKGGAKQSAPKNKAAVVFEQLPSVIPKAERGLVPGFGCMVTKAWKDAKMKRHYPLMVEIARTNMHRYWDKVTDVQSRASLLLMLGYSLKNLNTMEVDAMKEGKESEKEAMELIKSIEKRSAHDIVYGVWPESCIMGWNGFLEQWDPSERNKEMEWMVEMINLTRKTINSELERVADNHDHMKLLKDFSAMHYGAELSAIHIMSECTCLREEDAWRWLAIFGKRIEEIESLPEREGWILKLVKETKGSVLLLKCELCKRQGKVDLALEILREALDEEDPSPMLNHLHAELSLETGRIEEAFESLEKILSVFRSSGAKECAVNGIRGFLDLAPDESLSLCRELIPQYPHALWAASSAGFVELSEEEKKALRSKLETKKGLYCVNCEKEMTKIYRCSRCEVATYCGSACQKEAWKEHKKICKKRE